MSRNRKRADPPQLTMAMAPACSDCAFWLPTDPGVGECRRYPPVGRFPVLGGSMWCGEFQAITKPPEPTL